MSEGDVLATSLLESTTFISSNRFRHQFSLQTREARREQEKRRKQQSTKTQTKRGQTRRDSGHKTRKQKIGQNFIRQMRDFNNPFHIHSERSWFAVPLCHSPEPHRQIDGIPPLQSCPPQLERTEICHLDRHATKTNKISDLIQIHKTPPKCCQDGGRQSADIQRQPRSHRDQYS